MFQEFRKILILLDDRRRGDKRFHFLGKIQKECSLPRDILLSNQWVKIKNIINYAYQNVPFYRERFDSQGVRPEDVNDPSDLLKIPLLQKEDLRRNIDKMVSPVVPPSERVETATGGTTDSPVKIYIDRECLAKRRAATLFFYEWFGYRPGDKIAYLWGAEQDFPRSRSWKKRIHDLLISQELWLPSSYMNDEVMEEYYRKLRKFNSKVLQAYPTPLYLFSLFLEKKGYSLSIPYVNVASEYLYDYQREKIESVFQVKIFNWYGARELGHIATECCNHAGMHLNTYGIFLEVVKDGKHVLDEMGEFVFTDLLNKAMPLIRYKIGDIGVVSSRTCSCGCELPLIEEIGGRYVDTFKKRDGTFIPGVAFTNRIVKSYTGIKKLQIVQKDYDRFQLNIVKGPKYSSAVLDDLKVKICQFMHTQLDFEVRFVEDILPEKSGKIMFCKSEIAGRA